MAKLEFRGETISDQGQISKLIADHGMVYERWGTKPAIATDEEVLTAYNAEIERLKDSRGYVTADLIALRPTTPNLDVITAKFDKEHHHTEDEVRFVVEGEGVFELQAQDSEDFLKLTCEPGDLIVVPANRRHLFYLTDKKTIRCIRLFRNTAGWEAIYERTGA